MSDTEVGGIKGFLRLDDTEWDRTIAKAKADVRELKTMNADVRVSADTDRAEERIAMLAAAVRALDAESATIDVKVVERAGGGGSVATRSAADAQAQLTDAQEKAAVASMKADLAQARLNEAEEKGSRTASELMAKRIALAEATNRESAAVERAQRLTRQLNEARAAEAASAAAAAAGEAELASATRSSGDAAESSGKSFQVASTRTGLLTTGIVSLISTIGPLTGAAAAVGGAFLGMGAAGVLAVFGIKKAMDDGTDAGAAYRSGLQALKGDLDSLAATSAGAMLEHFQQAERTISGDMPALRGQIVGFSDALGDAGNSILTGLVKGFQVANPLMEQGQRLIVRVADGFERWASGDGLATFANEAAHDLPIVVDGLGNLAQGAVALLGALRPVGLTVIQVAGGIGQIAQVAAQAGPVLPALAAGAGAAWLGFKVWEGAKSLASGVQAGITVMSASMDSLLGASTRSAAATAGQAAAQGAVAATAPAAAAGEAAVAEGAVAMNTAMAANPIGLVVGLLAGLAAVTLVAMNATQQNTQATTDYTSALQQDGDAIGEHTAKLVAQELQSSKAMSTAKQYGITLTDMTKAVTGNRDAQSQINDVLDQQEQKLRKSVEAQSQAGGAFAGATGAASKQLDALRALRAEIDGQAKAVQKQKAQQDAANAASDKATNSIKSNAAAYEMTTGAYQKATDAAKKQAASSREATQAMQLENDAAGLLSNALTLLNGGALSVAQAQTGVASATNQAAKSFKDNGKSMDGNSAAAVANQQAIQGQVQAAQQMAEAQSKATGSTQAGVEAYKQSKTALEDALRAQGSLTPAVQAYIDKLYDVSNLTVKPTKLEIDKKQADSGIADLKKYIATIPGSHTTKADTLIDQAQRHIDQLKADLKTVPPDQQTKLRAEIAQAQANLDAVKRSIAGIPTSKTVTITTRNVQITQAIQQGAAPGAAKAAFQAHGGTAGVDGIRAQRFAEGGTSGSQSGSVWGSAGSSFSDKIPTWLSIGEEVSSAQAMAYPGARSVVKAINANPANTLERLTDSKAAVPAPVNVYVTGDGLRDVIRVEVEQQGRRRAASVKAGRRSGT
ncbi:hypothetical protein Csp2054_14315 [Curtobacterium sp. 'Ferrero']|uniref:hypothetical protein n=1 Tax=Curtobacterium sp. 'Ferrero' TaxID=2033654 RepID=UPI000BCA92D1|nr:hypothetical protein [Curtobacterium sp. 'Ferrero']PCN47013.1 hypothetical protein Csp2054_14315 [Curtobacterium sp. 'Ferrero']